MRHLSIACLIPPVLRLPRHRCRETQAYTRAYVLILAAGAPLIPLNHTLDDMLRDGDWSSRGLRVANRISTISNLILDPIFLVVFHPGVGGAAAATVLGNALAVLYAFLDRQRHKDTRTIEIRPAYTNARRALGSILVLGLPNANSGTLRGLIATFSSRLLVGYGNDTVVCQLHSRGGHPYFRHIPSTVWGMRDFPPIESYVPHRSQQCIAAGSHKAARRISCCALNHAGRIRRISSLFFSLSGEELCCHAKEGSCHHQHPQFPIELIVGLGRVV